MICITANTDGGLFTINKNYCEAVLKFGQLPLLISSYDVNQIDNILKMCDGIILSGGGDIHSKFFDQTLHPKANSINIERDEFEIALCKRAIKKNKPILAICRGMQILNIACGNGSLFQHIIGHVQDKPRDLTSHDVIVKDNSILHKIYKQRIISVNSIHHQAINKVGNGLDISATSQDIIEAIELKSCKFVIGVQWHPEALLGSVHDELFKAFVNATI